MVPRTKNSPLSLINWGYWRVFLWKEGDFMNESDDAIRARAAAVKQLIAETIDPESDEGKDFLFRSMAFGIMGVQPPKHPKVPEVKVVIGC